MSSIAAPGPRTEAREHAFSSTLWFPAWRGRVRAIELPYRRSGPHAVYKELIALVRILRSARGERVLMLNSSSGVIYPDLLARHSAPRLKGPYNLDARRAAGFTDDELAFLTQAIE